MKTLIVIELDIPARDAFACLPALTKGMCSGPAPTECGESVAGPIEFCCLPFGRFVCTMKADDAS